MAGLCGRCVEKPQCELNTEMDFRHLLLKVCLVKCLDFMRHAFREISGFSLVVIFECQISYGY